MYRIKLYIYSQMFSTYLNFILEPFGMVTKFLYSLFIVGNSIIHSLYFLMGIEQL